MNYRHIALSAALVSIACMRCHRRYRAGEPRAVIELFTSQGCSSCPPADKLLGELAQRSDADRAQPRRRLLGLSRLEGHAGACTAIPTAQRAYAEARGDREVYTPQVVVNGIVHVLGSDKAAIEKAIAQTRRRRRAAVAAGVADGCRRQGDGARAGRRGRAPTAPRSGSARSPARCRSRSTAAKTAATRSPTPMSCAAGSSSATGPARRRPSPCRSTRSSDGDRSISTLPCWCRAASQPSRA